MGQSDHSDLDVAHYSAWGDAASPRAAARPLASLGAGWAREPVQNPVDECHQMPPQDVWEACKAMRLTWDYDLLLSACTELWVEACSHLQICNLLPPMGGGCCWLLCPQQEPIE